MKLLLDENLSPRLVDHLHSVFPGSEHVDAAGLRGQTDHRIWEYAQRHGFAIVSKDNDFRQLAFLYGPPPKVIWLAVGNAGNEAIARLLEERAGVIQGFLSVPEEGLLVLEMAKSGA